MGTCLPVSAAAAIESSDDPADTDKSLFYEATNYLSTRQAQTDIAADGAPSPVTYDLHRRSSDVSHERPSLNSALAPQHSMDCFRRKYDLTRSRELGSGSCGMVVTVRSRETGDERAMKVVKAASTPSTRQLRKEIELHKKLDHPNICKLIESFEDGTTGEFYIIMELCTGGPLLKRMVRRGLDEPLAAVEMKKMLSAILYCHQHGVVHRDLKLDNMLYEDDRKEAELKLIDFGFASSVQPGNETMYDVMGSPSYMAPELWFETSYDSKVDLWALGAVAYTMVYMMLSGTRPFHHENRTEKARMVRDDPLSFPSPYWDGVSREARDFCKALMAKQPGTRLSASEAIRHPWITTRRSKPRDAACAMSTHTDVVASLEAYAEASTSPLKRLALEVIAFTMPPKQLKRLRRIFQVIDTDGTGTIDMWEWKDAVQPVLHKLSEGKLENIFHTIDYNGSGQIDYTEFLAATVSSCDSLVVNRSLRTAFHVLDGDNDGFITRFDVDYALKAHLSQSTLDAVMTSADSQGRVSYTTFKHAVLVL